MIERGEVDAYELRSEELDEGMLITYLIPECGENYTAEFYYPRNHGGGAYEGHRRSMSHMPSAYENMRLKDFRWDVYGGADMTMVKRIAEAVVARYDEIIQSGRGLYIYSKTPGSGKTMLACAIGNEVLNRRDLSVKFITAPRFVDLGKEDRYEYMGASLLILDDWGTQSEKQEWVVEVLFKLIDYRYENNLPTFYTSNLMPKASTKEDRIFSRINDTSVIVGLPEYSVRDERAKQYSQSFLKELLKDDA